MLCEGSITRPPVSSREAIGAAGYATGGLLKVKLYCLNAGGVIAHRNESKSTRRGRNLPENCIEKALQGSENLIHRADECSNISCR